MTLHLHSVRARLPGALVAACLVLAPSPVRAADPPVNWTADPARSTLEFTFVQAGAQTTGRFPRFTANIDLSRPDLSNARVDVNIDIGSVDTRDKDRDTQLRAPELFDVVKFPRAQYAATDVTANGSTYEAKGKLTLRGVTLEVPITFTFETTTANGRPEAKMKGSGMVKRLAFGVGQGEWKSTEWIADEVEVTFDLTLQPRSR